MHLGLTILLIGIVACHMTSAIQWKRAETHNQPIKRELPDQFGNHLAKVVSQAAKGFSFALFKSIAETNKKDLVCTPTSVFLVLGMASFGARGNTAHQLFNTLQLPPNDINFGLIGFEKFIKDLDIYNEDFAELVVANKIFLSDRLKLKSEYSDLTAKHFQSKVQSLDFSNPTAASKVINAWSYEQTHHHIKDVIKPENLVGAKIVLVNAVYFMAYWDKEFNPMDTELRTFYAANEYRREEKRIPTMYADGFYQYGVSEEIHAKFVYLPFEDSDQSNIGGMFILLPDEKHNLADVEKSLKFFSIQELFNEMKKTHVELTLPKFEIENRIELSEPLEKMGLTDIFDDTADLSGMVEGSNSLKVSVLVQNAMIKVDEVGVTAAGVTEAGMTNRQGNEPPPTPSILFHVDRPFISFIVSSAHEVPLFISRYTGL